MELDLTTQLTEISDLNKLCRTCLNKQSDMMPIFNEYFVNMLLTCTNIKVLIGDGLPCNICITCRKLLYLSYSFRRKCEKANHALKNYLLEQKTNTALSDKSSSDSDEQNNFDIESIKPNNSGLSFDVANVMENLLLSKNKYVGESKETQTELIYSSNVKFEFITEFNDAVNKIELNETTEKCLFEDPKPEIDITDYPLTENKRYMTTRSSSKQTKIKSFYCAICEDSFSDSTSLKDHHALTHKTKHNCSYCDEIFSDSEEFRTHVRSHRGVRPVVCPECNKTFRDQKGLQRHMKIHNGVKSHICSQCDKAFLHSDTLDTHMRSHTGEKPFECTFCQKSFMTSSNLAVHRRRHTGERPYQCNVCDKRFISSGILNQHSLIHSGEKRYVCNVCGKRVARQFDLTTHMRSHSGEKPYICQLCKKTFATSSHLAVHKRKHRDERNYVCPTCGKAFVESGVLKSHLRVHSGEKPYQCSVCSKAFSQSGSLSTHMKSHK